MHHLQTLGWLGSGDLGGFNGQKSSPSVGCHRKTMTHEIFSFKKNNMESFGIFLVGFFGRFFLVNFLQTFFLGSFFF